MYRLGDSFLVSWRRLFVDRWVFPSTQVERSEYQIFRFGVAFLQFFSSDSFRVSSFTFLDALNLTHAERRNQVRFLFDGFVQLLCRNFDLHFVFFTSICLSFRFAVVSFFFVSLEKSFSLNFAKTLAIPFLESSISSLSYLMCYINTLRFLVLMEAMDLMRLNGSRIFLSCLLFSLVPFLILVLI